MIITRYLSKEVINAMLMVTIVLLLAFLSQQVVRYLNFVVIGKIATNVLLELVSFEVPYLLSFLLPLGLYLGILLAYGRLYADNEMAILQLCGYGHRRILNLTMVIAVAIAGIVLVLMLWVNPWISAIRQQVMESDDVTVHLVQTLIPGRFQASQDGSHVMYVEKLSRDHMRAENVFLAQEKKYTEDETEQSSWALTLANEGYQEKNKDGNFFVMADGYRYDGLPGHNDFKIIQFKKYYVRIPSNEEHISHQQVETLSTLQLWLQSADPKYAAELQWRISIALSSLLLAFLAVPLSKVRPRHGRYLALLPAVLIYIIYINLLFIARRWLEQGVVPPIIGMWWVHFLILFLALISMTLSTKGK